MVRAYRRPPARLPRSGAIVVDARRGELAATLPVNLVLLVPAAFVAIGRFAGWG